MKHLCFRYWPTPTCFGLKALFLLLLYIGLVLQEILLDFDLVSEKRFKRVAALAL